MFIFAWLSLASYRVLDQVVRAQDTNQRKSEQVAQIQRVNWQLAKDFRQMVNRPVVDIDGNDLPGLALEGELNILEFTRSGWSNPLQWPRSDLQRVAYRIDYHPDYDDDQSAYYQDDRLFLIRLYWQVLDRTIDTQPLTQVMIGGVVDFRARFWDKGSQEWSDTKTTALARKPGVTDYNLPQAIEVSIVLESDEVITRIFRIL